MPNLKISQLPLTDASALKADDLFAIVQTDGTGTAITRRIKYSDLVKGINNSINATAGDIRTAITNSTLVPGAFYKINFTTKHVIPGTTVINSASAPEELVLVAIASNKIAPQAYSLANPRDIIILDLTSPSSIVCEDNTTQRDGKILYRKDTVTNLETWYDFRVVKFRRWQIDVASSGVAAWVASKAYVLGDKVRNGNFIYRCNYAHTSTATFQDIYWQVVIEQDTTNRLAWATSMTLCNTAFTANSAITSDFLTFTGTCKNISIKPTSDGSYNNIVFMGTGTVTDNDFGYNCKNMTIVESSKNRFGNNCTSFVLNGSGSNIIESDATQLYLKSANKNIIEQGCNGITILTAENNSVRAGANNSMLQSSSNCELGKRSFNNIIKASNYAKVQYGADAQSGNIIDASNYCETGYGAYGNIISGGSHHVRIGDKSNRNRITSSSHSNVLGINCSNNVITNFNSNILGNNCADNILNGASSRPGNSNVFGNDCQANNLMGSNVGNKLENGCSGNRFGYGASHNTLHNNCFYISIMDNPGATEGTGGYSNNLFGAGCDSVVLRGNNNSVGEGCVSLEFSSVNGSKITSALSNKTFNGSFEYSSILISNDAAATYDSNYYQVVVDIASPDGNFWYKTITNTGSIITNKLV